MAGAKRKEPPAGDVRRADVVAALRAVTHLEALPFELLDMVAEYAGTPCGRTHWGPMIYRWPSSYSTVSCSHCGVRGPPRQMFNRMFNACR